MQKFDLQVIGFSFLIVAGIALIGLFYQNSIQPLELTQFHFDEIIGTSDPEIIKIHLVEIKQNLAIVMIDIQETKTSDGKIISKNPVWIFPTESTNFLRIENDVDRMITSIENISVLPRDSSAFHTGMLDINARSDVLRENIQDVIPYMTGNLESAVSSTIIIVGSFGLIGTLWRKQNPPN